MATPEVRFPLLFLAWSVSFYFLEQRTLLGVIDQVRTGTTAAVVAGTRLTGLDAVSTRDSIVTFGGGTFTYQIVRACTAWSVAALFAAAVLAYPAAWVQRMAALLVGFPAIFVLNVIRLVSMAWVGAFHPALFDATHGFWWQILIVLCVGAGWVLWVRVVEARKRGEPLTGRVALAARTVLTFFVLALTLYTLGAWTGVGQAYAALVRWVASGLVSTFVGRSPPLAETRGDAYSSGRVYGGLVAMICLYAVTPRVKPRARLQGGAFWGLPSRFSLDVFVTAVWMGMAVGWVPFSEIAYYGNLVLGAAGSVVVWSLWSRRRWAAMDAGVPVVDCPACGVPSRELRVHLRAEHGPQARKLWRAAVRENPKLRRQGPAAAMPTSR